MHRFETLTEVRNVRHTKTEVRLWLVMSHPETRLLHLGLVNFPCTVGYYDGDPVASVAADASVEGEYSSSRNGKCSRIEGAVSAMKLDAKWPV